MSFYDIPKPIIYKSRFDAIDGKQVIYGKDNELLEERNYKNGVLNGPLKKWWPSGELFLESFYSDGLLDGPYRRWAGIDDIHLIEEAFYVKGKLEGLRRLWFIDKGTIYKEENYKEGVLHGHYREYAYNGSITRECDY